MYWSVSRAAAAGLAAIVVLVAFLATSGVDAAPAHDRQGLLSGAGGRQHTKLVYVVIPDSFVSKVIEDAVMEQRDDKHTNELLDYLDNVANENEVVTKRRYLPSKRRYLFT